MQDFEKTTSESLDRIEEQTLRTNGTVRWLVKMMWLSMGFCACLTAIVLPLLFILITTGKL